MSAKRKFDPAIDDENPEWTKGDFEKSRDAEELPRGILSQFRKPGRPRLENPKEPVKLRLDSDVLAALRKSGPGWQTRVNGLLRSKLKGGRIMIPGLDMRDRSIQSRSKRKRA